MSNEFNKILTTDECKLLVERKLGTNKFTLKHFSIEPFSKTRIGYLSDHLRLKCEVSYNNQITEIQFFVKRKSENIEENCVALVSKNYDLFKNEVTILELFLKNQTLSSVNWAPKLYMQKDGKYLFLENLNERGFIMSKVQSFDLKHFQVGLRTLAKFHTFSFKYINDKRKMNPTYSMTDEFAEIFDEVIFQKKNEFGEKSWRATEGSLLYLVNWLPEQKYQRDRVKKLLIEKFNRLPMDLQQYKNPYNVISHGDIWGNNLMFRYSETNPNEPCDCCLVDFQVLRFLPPAQDVLYFLYMNALKDFRQQYFEELMDFYYKSLSEELNKVGLKSDVIYPLNEYRKHCKERLLSILFINACYKPLFLMGEKFAQFTDNKEDNFQLYMGDRYKYVDKVAQTNPVYKNLVLQEFQELVDELIKND